MKRIALILLILILLANITFAFPEEKFKSNIISNINSSDLIDQDKNPKATSVVVGYDSAVTDYIYGAQLAIFLTALNQKRMNINLFCDKINGISTLFIPSQRQVIFTTDNDLQTESRILIGGMLVNKETNKYKAVVQQVEDQGDILIWKINKDIIVAGYTALDTQKGIKYVIDLIQSNQR